MRLTFVISSLAGGGAQRVMSIIADYWASMGRNITLITLDSKDTDFYTLRPEVKRVTMGLMTVSSNFYETCRNTLQRLRHLRREIRASQPDAVISFISRMNILTLVATLGLNIPVIISERNNPRKQPATWYSAASQRLIYPYAHAIVVQTDRIGRWVQKFVPQKKIYTIPNPVIKPPVCEEKTKHTLPNIHTIVSMGRLTPQKGFDLLLPAFAKCAPKHPNWSLLILGEGDDRKHLQKLAEELKIANRLNMTGTVQEPSSILYNADIFVMSSRYEGFPNALLEAMACSLPVISFDCPTGPREIIHDGVNGILVPPEDVDALASTMDRLMSDESERKRLASRAIEVIDQFSLEKVMEGWEEVLNQVTKRKG